MFSRPINRVDFAGLVSIMLRDVDAAPLPMIIEAVILGCATSSGIVGVIDSDGMGKRRSAGGILVELGLVTHTTRSRISCLYVWTSANYFSTILLLSKLESNPV